MWRRAGWIAAVTTLVASAAPIVAPAEATSPGDNGVLAFVVEHSDGCFDLRTVQVAGTSAKTLAKCPQYIGEPAWGPGGKELAVSYIHGSGAEHLALLPATGGTPQVVSTSVTPVHSPAFDRTGQVIAFTSGEAGPDTRALYTVPVTGGTATRLTPASSTETNDEPDYSPTADAIAWTRRTATSYDVWTMSVDAQGRNPTALTNLTNGIGNSRYPSWSPDGTRLAFASDRSGTWQVYVMSSTGTGVTQVTSGSAAHIQPVWSPDGTKIAFTTGCTTSNCNTQNDKIVNGKLQVIDVTDVAHPGAPQTIIATSAAEFDPQWARACADSSCAPAGSLSRSLSLKPFGHGLKARGSVSSAKSVCKSHVPVVLQYQNVIDRRWNKHRHWLTEGKTTTATSGAYHLRLPRLLTGWYRTRTPARRLGTIACPAVVSPIRQNLTIRDKRGDARGPVDMLIAWATVRHGVITMTIETAGAIPAGQVGKPCVLFFAQPKNPNKNHYGGSVGCVSNTVLDVFGAHKPLTTRRPNSRTIVYSFKMSELGRKFGWMEWVPYSRGHGDADWWDVIPNDSDLGTLRPPGNPHDMAYLFKKKPSYIS